MKEGQKYMETKVDHPSHYGGEDNVYEAIKVIEAWGLNFRTGNAAKYIARAGKKDPSKEIEDLKKAVWYLNREIDKLEHLESIRIPTTSIVFSEPKPFV